MAQAAAGVLGALASCLCKHRKSGLEAGNPLKRHERAAVQHTGKLNPIGQFRLEAKSRGLPLAS